MLGGRVERAVFRVKVLEEAEDLEEGIPFHSSWVEKAKGRRESMVRRAIRESMVRCEMLRSTVVG